MGDYKGEPEPEVWTVHTLWKSTYDGDPNAIDGSRDEYSTWAEAKKQALGLSCLAGVVAIKVIDPDGDVYANYDRWSNMWHEPKHRTIHAAHGTWTRSGEGAVFAIAPPRVRDGETIRVWHENSHREDVGLDEWTVVGIRPGDLGQTWVDLVPSPDDKPIR